MELPKNITQIGEADDKCKIYVEDYVVSYLRQMNQLARNKEMALALYGTSTDEEDKTYVFLYGAARVNYLQKEVRHLSQAQKQEIESNRVRYFNEYSFGNNRKTYRIIIFENNDSIFCYKVEDKPYLKENTLFFPYEETIGSKIVLRDALPKKVYLNGELILLVKIK